jgi:hypothetical protein
LLTCGLACCAGRTAGSIAGRTASLAITRQLRMGEVMSGYDQKVAIITGGSQGILFLESSPFITGEILHIDGGQIAGH